MSKKTTLQVAALKRARDLAGGVTYLARKLGIDSNSLDDMIQEKDGIPQWIFLRAVDFINETEMTGTIPPGFPADWQERLWDDKTTEQ